MTLLAEPGAPMLDPSVPLLAEQFKAAGYRTVGFCNNGLAGERFIGRGFDEYYERRQVAHTITERIMDEHELESGRAPGTNQKIYAWLEQPRREPFFMFVLYYEPHSPYDPTPEHDIFKTDAYPDATFIGYDPQKGHLLRKAAIGDGAAVERLNGLYDGLIHYVDFHYGQLLTRLGELGLDGSTLVVLFSDHGELIFEYPDVLTFDHVSLYDANIHVPLIIKGKAIPKGRVVDAMVSHIDIAPTLLELAGLEPLAGAQGTSLVPLISGEADSAHKYVFSEQDILTPLRSVRDTRHKLIWDLQSGKKQLFDTLADPGERNDVATVEPEVADRLSAVLERWIVDNQLPEDEREALWRKTIDAGSDEVVDDVTTSAKLQLSGTGWRVADHPDCFRNGCYWTQPSVSGSNAAVWRPENPLVGPHNVYVWYGRIPDVRAATNAQYTVKTRTGSQAFVVDQNEGTGRWNLLGEFAGPVSVALTNAADGPIVVDAVKFEQVRG
jgi:arylsulfatase A-like enzyme